MTQLVFDLETQRSFQDVGGRNASNFAQMGMSLAVTYDIDSATYKTYLEADVQQLVADLLAADKVIGFNIKNFDFEVLRGYSQADFKQVKSLDMLEIIYRTLGFRVSLDKLGEATLKQNKSADGLLAIKWFREGKWKELEDYCRQDVVLTTQLYNYGKDNGYLCYPSFKGIQKVVVKW